MQTSTRKKSKKTSTFEKSKSQNMKVQTLKIGLLLSKEYPKISIAEGKTLLSKFFLASNFVTDANLLTANIPLKVAFETNKIKNEDQKINQEEFEKILLPELLSTFAKKISTKLERLALTRKAFLIIAEETNPPTLLKELETNWPKNKLELSTKLLSNLTKAHLKNNKLTFKLTKQEISTSKINKLSDELFFQTTKIIGSNQDLEVDMKQPFYNYNIIIGKKTYFGLQIWENAQDFEERKAHKRPFNHPTSMNPKFARALVNLASPESELLDPFCGAGGIIIESALLNIETIGIDINSEMIERAKANLEHFNAKAEFLVQDALTYDKQVECVVTDVPYGRSSILKDKLPNLMTSFLSKYYDLTETIVVCFPDSLNFNKIKGNWKIENEFSIYIHGSLTRKIVVLKK